MKSALVMFGLVLVGSWAQAGMKVATAPLHAREPVPDLAGFQMDNSGVTQENLDAAAAADFAEGEDLKAARVSNALAFPNLSPLGQHGEAILAAARSPRLFIQYFLKAPSFGGKQFLMASLDGKLKHVFAISGGAQHDRRGRSIIGSVGWTPTSTFAKPYGVNNLSEHAESNTFPGRDRRFGYGNMDFFINFYGEGIAGFHATLIGAYATLGLAASHGCIRQARGEAETLFRLVQSVGGGATIVGHRAGIDPTGVDVAAVQRFLLKDLEHIRGLKSRNEYGRPQDLPDQPQGLRVDIPQPEAAPVRS